MRRHLPSKERNERLEITTLVLPYHAKDELYYAQYYDEILCPIPEKCHFKSAITKRNQWIMEHSDLLIAYVETTTGGAYQAVKYAEKNRVPIINLHT